MQSKPNKLAEIFNASTHGLATILSILGLVYLIIKGLSLSSVPAIVAYSIYGASLILLFLNSTLYHSLKFTKFRSFFQKLDHGSIYLLIAGTYTPYLMLAIAGKIGYTFLAIIWIIAGLGIFFEIHFTNKHPRLSLFMYLLLGWMGVLLIYPLVKFSPIYAVILLALGGVFYSLGTIFYSMKDKEWMHVIWHLFVMAGALFMYISIFFYI